MAYTVVQKAQSTGGANNTSQAISAATAGNTLVSAFSQTGLNTPTCTGFAVQAVSAVYNGSASSVWVATKIAAGGETSVAWTAGSGGTGHGVAVFELGGGPATVTLDGSVGHTDNIASGTAASLAMATSAANSIVLLFVGSDTSTGTIGAWTGTNVATNIGTAAARCFGGSFITTTTISSTFTGNWTTAHVSGMIGIALKISAGSTQAVAPAAINATSSVGASVQKLAAVKPAAINATSSVASSVSKLAAVKPAAITATSNTSATVVKLAAVRPSAINDTSTVAASVVALRAVAPAAFTASSTVSGTVTKAGAGPPSAVYQATDWTTFHYLQGH